MDDIDTELAFILASCKNKGQLDYQIARYAKIVQQLVIQMANEVNQTEEGIMRLYNKFADLAVEQFGDTRQFPGKKPH
jgi:hypothetical protein